MQRSGAIAALYLSLTFCTGVAVGGLGFWMYQTRSVRADVRKHTADEYRRRYLDEMKARLRLSEEQMAKLVVLLDTTRNTYRELNEKHRPEYEAIQGHQREQMRSLLDESQRPEYEKMLAERAKRKRGGPPPAPGY